MRVQLVGGIDINSAVSQNTKSQCPFGEGALARLPPPYFAQVYLRFLDVTWFFDYRDFFLLPLANGIGTIFWWNKAQKRRTLVIS